ncbi:MAG: hypothetical protein ABIH24_07615 [Verrucomicrobiota bacterium]
MSLTAQAADAAGKPPKLFARLSMAPPTAPQVIGDPGKRGDVSGFSGKQRLMGWVIGFLIAVIIVLLAAIKLVHTEAKNAKQSNMAVVEQIENLRASMAAVEKEKAVLKTSIAELEKQVVEGAARQKALEQLREKLAQENKARTEVEVKLVENGELRRVAQDEIADLHRKINDMEEQIAGAEQWADALQDEFGKEQKARKELEAKAGNQAQAPVDAQAEHVAEGPSQQKASDQIQAELVREKQVHTEIKARIVEANQARASAAQTMAGLKQKLIEGEAQSQLQDRLQAELADARKMNAEMKDEAQRVMAFRAEAEQAVADLTIQLAAAQTNINVAPEQAGVILQMQADVEKEKQANVAAMAQLEKEEAIIDAAQKEKTVLQARIAELEKQSAEGAVQQKALEQLRENLAQAKQAQAEAKAKLTGLAEAKKAVQNETADLKRRLNDVDNQMDKQAKQIKALKGLQAELSEEQKARQKSEAEAEKKTMALASVEQERDALKSRLADMEQQYAARQEQVKVVAQVRADLKRERELREQTDKRAVAMAAQEKARARQIRELKDQVQTAAKNNTALAKDLEHQSQQAAIERKAADEMPAVESKQAHGEPESVTAAEKKILVQAAGKPETGATESAPDADKTTGEASGALRPAVSEANRHYMMGIQKWDAGDVDGAIAEFKKTVSLDSSAAGAYYNIALGYARKGDRDKACDYAYQAGEIYLKNKNNKQATRMVVFIKKIDPTSSLIEKLRKQIAKKQS